MSELNRLCELLDEAGVSYLRHKGDITIGYYTEDPNSVIEAMDGTVMITGLTADQVMRALGSGTCEYCKDGKFDGQTVMMSNHGWQRINFCPHCGRKVADE